MIPETGDRKPERWRAIDAAVFRTITSEDWKRSLAVARAERNVAWEQIREAIRRAHRQAQGLELAETAQAPAGPEKILDGGLGKSQPVNVGK